MKALLEQSIAHAVPQLCPPPTHHKSPHILLDLKNSGKPSSSSPGFFKSLTSSFNNNNNKRKNSPSNSSSCSSSRNGVPISGGGQGGDNKMFIQQQDGGENPSSSPSPLAVHESDIQQEQQEEEDEKSREIRSFWCLNVGPTFDGSRWRSFSDEEYRRFDEDLNPCMLPCEMQAEVLWQLVSKVRTARGGFAWVKEQIEEWYHGHGFTAAKVAGFTGLTKGLLCCKISEGIITEIRVSYKNQRRLTSKDVVSRQLSMALVEGMVYNVNSVKEAKHRLQQLHVFEKVTTQMRRNHHGGVSVEFVLEEKLQDSCHFQSGLSFMSSESGRPILSSLRPAATLSVEHCNIAGMNRTLQGYIHSNDLLRPQDDSRFKLEYVHPYVDGIADPRDRTLRVSCYNSRKLTAVVAHSPYDREVPAVWVDRAGLKTSITENFTKESKLSYGFVVEEIATRDGLGGVADAGGIEHVPFLQVKITRDNTVDVNGYRVGAVDMFQVEQGVGFTNKALLFNKQELSCTRFIPLRISSSSSFPLAIVRGRYGGIVGDSPSYRDFALRGSVGETGGCTSFVEMMTEVRLPVWTDYVYGFVDMFTELDGVLYHGQSFRSLARTAGRGLLLGLGMKTGDFRTEFVFDCGTTTGSFNVQLGDRV